MMASLWKRWDQYWFRSAPLVNLDVVRILLVGLQLKLLSLLTPEKTQSLFELPKDLYWPLPIFHLLHLPLGWNWQPDPGTYQIVFWLTLCAGVLALLGLFTNMSVGLFATGCLFLQGFHYSFEEIHHSQAIMLIALPILALTPCNRVISLDAWRKKTFFQLDRESPFARWGLLLIQVVFALVYFSAAYSKAKTAGFEWLNGYTLQYYLLEDGLRWNCPAGVWLAQQHGLAVLLSYFSLIFEWTFFFVLIWPALAWFYVPAGIGFHAGIYITQKAGFPEFVAMYAVFVSWHYMLKTMFSPMKKSPTLLFDGVCNLCNGFVNFVIDRDEKGRIKLGALQSPEGQARLKKKAAPDDLSTIVFIEDDQVYTRSEAVLRMTRYLDGVWTMARFFLFVPPFIRDHVYMWVAKNRYRWFGKQDQCRVPTPELKKRFL